MNTSGYTNIHHVLQSKQARKDWKTLAAEAEAAGLSDWVDQLRPSEDAGWRTIDRSIARLQELMVNLDVELMG